MELWLIFFIIFTALIFVICGGVYWYNDNQRRRRALIQYSTADSYSTLESEVKFKNSKNTKIWIGQVGLGNIINKQKNELLREQYAAYAVAVKITKNWCNLSNMVNTQHDRKMVDELPCIGHRQFSKFYHPMYDERYGSRRLKKSKKLDKRLLLCHYDCNQLPPLNDALLSDSQLPLGKHRLVDFRDDEQYRAFRLLLETLQHPYIMTIHEINLSTDKRHLFIMRDLEKKGSLRDHIHSSDLSQAYGEKYCTPGKPLPMQRIRKYGRQILEALSYLNECGLPCYHLHSGNVIIQDENAKITEVENVFMGYQLRHPLHQHLCAVKKIYADLHVEVCLFGYILFEMATGYESPTPSPLDGLLEIPVELDRSITHMLGRIFGDKSLGDTPTVDGLINDPLFNATNVPKGDVSMFVSLKQENEMVQHLGNAITMQCYNTYSMDVLLGDKRRRSSLAKRKKKKKKKRKRRKDDAEKEEKTIEDPLSNVYSSAKVKRTMSDEEGSSAHENDLWSTM
eukprot:335984_1